MKEKIKLLQDQATTNLRVKQLYNQASMTWDMQWDKLAEKAEGKGISVVPYIVTGSGLNLMPEFNKYEFARLIILDVCNKLQPELGQEIREFYGVKE